MAHVIEVKGKAAVVFGLKDLMELIDQHMGMEFRTILEETLSEIYVNRNAISKCAGKIGTLTWREL